MIKVTTLCRHIATVLAVANCLALYGHAQQLLDSYPTYGIELQQPASSVLELPLELPQLSVEPMPQVALEEFSQPPTQQAIEAPPADLNVLTRGPLHEAFASAHRADPLPSALVSKTPPDLIDELPPEYKPEGNNVQWISGYWAWDETASDFIWISGVWRDLPPNRTWVPGYWNSEEGGSRWVSGIWAESAQSQQAQLVQQAEPVQVIQPVQIIQPSQQVQLGYLPAPPASIDQGPSSAAPGDQHFYIPGNWQHQDGSYRWTAGYWQPIVENWIWIPARYVWTPQGCVYQSGYWDYELQNRGTCFAPIQFPQSIFVDPTYHYQPSFAIDLNIDFMAHLFVRPDCGHYFYGNWYGSTVNQVAYQPWVSYSSHFRSYDPLLTYYRCRRSTFDSRYNVVQYLTGQHNFYVNNRDYRPRTTYRSQFANATRLLQLGLNGSATRGRSYDRFVRSANYVTNYKQLRDRNSRTGRSNVQSSVNRYRKIQDQDLRNTRQKVEQLAKSQRDRQLREQAQLSREKQNRLQQQRDNARRVAQQDHARRSQQEASRRQAQARVDQQQVTRSRQQTFYRQQDQSRLAQQDQVRRIQQDQVRRVQEQRSREQVAERSRQQAAERSRQQQQAQFDAVRRSQQDQARRAQQDQARRAQQDQARRAQQDQARYAQTQRSRQQQAQRDALRRSQQDQARRAQQDQARRAQQDQARRAQQDQARRAQEQRSRQQAAERSRQQQAQRDAARQAQQRRSQQDQARRSQQAASASKHNRTRRHQEALKQHRSKSKK